MHEFWKSIKIWQSYREFKGGNFFETQCRTNRRLIVVHCGYSVHCDHTVHFSADLGLWLDSPMLWAPWHQSMSTYSKLSFSRSTWNMCKIGKELNAKSVNQYCVCEFNGHRLYIGFRSDYRLRSWAPTSALRAISAVAAVAAQGCLPLGANVCVAAPAYQISSAIRVFFRISDMGVWTNPWGSPPLPSILLPCHTPISHLFSPIP